MKWWLLALIVGGWLSLSVAGEAAPLTASPVLTRVWLSGHVIHATFNIPNGMQPYALRFVPPVHPWTMAAMLPGFDDGQVTPSGFIAKPQITLSLSFDELSVHDGQLASRPVTFRVELIYGRKGACGRTATWNSSHLSYAAITRCPTRQVSALRFRFAWKPHVP
jgi:hypothetical protein